MAGGAKAEGAKRRVEFFLRLLMEVVPRTIIHIFWQTVAQADFHDAKYCATISLGAHKRAWLHNLQKRFERTLDR
jgi:hypothetical protein